MAVIIGSLLLILFTDVILWNCKVVMYTIDLICITQESDLRVVSPVSMALSLSGLVQLLNLRITIIAAASKSYCET